jgi:hypothetical protein
MNILAQGNEWVVTGLKDALPPAHLNQEGTNDDQQKSRKLQRNYTGQRQIEKGVKLNLPDLEVSWESYQKLMKFNSTIRCYLSSTISLVPCAAQSCPQVQT